MMFMVFALCFLRLPGNEGASDAYSVLQTPRFIIKRSGESVASEIKCSHSITNYYVILWYKQDERRVLKLLGYLSRNNPKVEDEVKGKISFDGDGSKQSSLSISNLTLQDSGVYFCAARTEVINEPPYFGQGTKLTVLEPDREVAPPTVKVLPPSSEECRNQKDRTRKKTLVCVASGFYPDHVSVLWKVNKFTVTEGVATDNAALRDGEFYTITSRLRVEAETWYRTENTFTCIVSFFNETHTIDYPISINGTEAPDAEGVMTREKYLNITQKAKLSYSVFIVKSCIYGVFVAFLVWRLQDSAGKQKN